MPSTTKIRKLSKGMAQLVQLLGSVVHQPDLLVLDEPFSGLDPVNQERLEALILAERDRGATILFSTHVMAHAERLCDRLAIIAGGKRAVRGHGRRRARDAAAAGRTTCRTTRCRRSRGAAARRCASATATAGGSTLPERGDRGAAGRG